MPYSLFAETMLFGLYKRSTRRSSQSFVLLNSSRLYYSKPVEKLLLLFQELEHYGSWIVFSLKKESEQNEDTVCL